MYYYQQPAQRSETYAILPWKSKEQNKKESNFPSKSTWRPPTRSIIRDAVQISRMTKSSFYRHVHKLESLSQPYWESLRFQFTKQEELVIVVTIKCFVYQDRSLGSADVADAVELLVETFSKNSLDKMRINEHFSVSKCLKSFQERNKSDIRLGRHIGEENIRCGSSNGDVLINHIAALEK